MGIYKSSMTGEQLKSARLRLGLGIRACAREAGVAPSTVIRWEQMDRLPKAATLALRRILKALGVRTFHSDATSKENVVP